MNKFYISDIKIGSIALSAEESAHCIRVLRLNKGDHVEIMNGKGAKFDAVISVADPKSCHLEVLKENSEPKMRPYHLTIAIAPTKNMDRFEWFIEKSTEIGIDRIIPLICQHSERKELKSERLEKILVSAMKQSGQAFLPELTPKTTFKELVIKPFDGEKLIAHCEKTDKKKLKNSITAGKNVLMLIGPEGDFAVSEIQLALEHGFIPVTLGDSVLRTETAGIVACHTVSLVNET